MIQNMPEELQRLLLESGYESPQVHMVKTSRFCRQWCPKVAQAKRPNSGQTRRSRKTIDKKINSRHRFAVIFGLDFLI